MGQGATREGWAQSWQITFLLRAVCSRFCVPTPQMEEVFCVRVLAVEKQIPPGFSTIVMDSAHQLNPRSPIPKYGLQE